VITIRCISVKNEYISIDSYEKWVPQLIHAKNEYISIHVKKSTSQLTHAKNEYISFDSYEKGVPHNLYMWKMSTSQLILMKKEHLTTYTCEKWVPHNLYMRKMSTVQGMYVCMWKKYSLVYTLLGFRSDSPDYYWILSFS